MARVSWAKANWTAAVSVAGHCGAVIIGGSATFASAATEEFDLSFAAAGARQIPATT